VQDSRRSEHVRSPSARRAVDALEIAASRKGVAISISGIDGSGKSSLAQVLVQMLQRSTVSVRYMHVYRWYANILTTPVVILYNRYVSRRVLVLDRCIYDNIGVAAARQGVPNRLFRAALRVVLACYPEFDHRFYLVVPFAETLRRRPDTREKEFMTLTAVYENIAARAGYVRLQSDSTLIEKVLNVLSGDPIAQKTGEAGGNCAK
jgi:thymidylate kinase